MAKTDPVDMVLDIIKIAAVSIIGFIIIKVLLQAFIGS
jgi:hypothetical protein